MKPRIIRIWYNLNGKWEVVSSGINPPQMRFKKMAIVEISSDEKYIDLYMKPFWGSIKPTIEPLNESFED
jgi:hypothetical protein